MDLQSLYYFKELTKELNISKCAERLFISPQTLSNHIIRIEKEYNTKLFRRTPIFTLTPAGYQMLEFAEKTLASESKLKSIFSEINQQKMGIIRFGTTGVRADCALPLIEPKFSKKYPHIQIQLTDGLSTNLRGALATGELDLILSTITKEDEDFAQEFTVPYKIYVCVSDELLNKYYGAESSAMKERLLKGATIADLARLPFLLITPPNIIGTTVEKCIKESGITPIKYMSASYTSLAPLICQSSLAACFMSQTYWLSSLRPTAQNVNIFPLLYKNKPVVQTMALLHRHNQYIPEYLKYFIQLLEACFRKLEPIEVARLAQTNRAVTK